MIRVNLALFDRVTNRLKLQAESPSHTSQLTVKYFQQSVDCKFSLSTRIRVKNALATFLNKFVTSSSHWSERRTSPKEYNVSQVLINKILNNKIPRLSFPKDNDNAL